LLAFTDPARGIPTGVHEAGGMCGGLLALTILETTAQMEHTTTTERRDGPAAVPGHGNAGPAGSRPAREELAASGSPEGRTARARMSPAPVTALAIMGLCGFMIAALASGGYHSPRLRRPRQGTAVTSRRSVAAATATRVWPRHGPMRVGHGPMRVAGRRSPQASSPG